MTGNKYMRTLLAAGIVIGIGMGGFVDGILFHQLLQIHNMLSNILFPNTVANIEINMFWDGLFHAFTWFTTAAGIILLWKALTPRAAIPSPLLFNGGLLIGFGIFNVVEGILDHLLLQVHHVIQRASPLGQFLSDISFIFFGVLLILAGAYFVKQASKLYSS